MQNLKKKRCYCNPSKNLLFDSGRWIDSEGEFYNWTECGTKYINLHEEPILIVHKGTILWKINSQTKLIPTNKNLEAFSSFVLAKKSEEKRPNAYKVEKSLLLKIIKNLPTNIISHKIVEYDGLVILNDYFDISRNKFSIAYVYPEKVEEKMQEIIITKYNSIMVDSNNIIVQNEFKQKEIHPSLKERDKILSEKQKLETDCYLFKNEEDCRKINLKDEELKKLGRKIFEKLKNFINCEQK